MEKSTYRYKDLSVRRISTGTQTADVLYEVRILAARYSNSTHTVAGRAPDEAFMINGAKLTEQEEDAEKHERVATPLDSDASVNDGKNEQPDPIYGPYKSPNRIPSSELSRFSEHDIVKRVYFDSPYESHVCIPKQDHWELALVCPTACDFTPIEISSIFRNAIWSGIFSTNLR